MKAVTIQFFPVETSTLQQGTLIQIQTPELLGKFVVLDLQSSTQSTLGKMNWKRYQDCIFSVTTGEFTVILARIATIHENSYSPINTVAENYQNCLRILDDLANVIFLSSMLGY